MRRAIPQSVMRALEGYTIILREQKDLEIKKKKFGEILKKFIEDARKEDPEFNTFDTEYGSATLVEPVEDYIDADALWTALKKHNLLSEEVKAAFTRVVNKHILIRLIDELKLPRKIVKRYWSESPGKSYVKVTPAKG